MNQMFDSTDERYSIRHLTGQVRSAVVQRSIFVLSVIHPLHVLIRQITLIDRSLSVTALLVRFMRSLHVSRRPSSPPRQLSSPDDHWINIFCIFSVRSASVTLVR